MNTRIICWATALLLTGIWVGQAAPPPNDNYADRIVLTGNDVVFTGTVAEATIQLGPNGFVEVSPYGIGLAASVWWSWTATQTSPVILETLDSNESNAFNNVYVMMTAWPPPNPQLGFPVITNFSVGGIRPVDSLFLELPRSYVVFLATNGVTYSFQLAGTQSTGHRPSPMNSFRFRLTASAAPVIKEQPLSLTVLANASPLFKVQAVGVPYLSYQWQVNRQDIPGEQAVVLGLTNVIPSQAGNYSVRVSNSGGSVTSAVACLRVVTNDLPPLLSVRGPGDTNRFGFDVLGATGRSYRMESSTDLVHWINEKSFDSGSLHDFQGRPILTSVIFNTGTLSSLQVPAITPRKYFRASPYMPSNEICNMNLKLLRFGKDIWAWEKQKTSSDTPVDMDLYGTSGSLHRTYPTCPAGGVYTIQELDVLPTCSIPGHVLEEQR